jgi:SAM-dependent methyltransferase
MSLWSWTKAIQECANYNDCVDASVAERLREINRLFYAEHGDDFSETRQKLQPGVKRLVATIHGDEPVLDLGCGNGALARRLSGRGHRAPYVGLDFSPSLLDEARAATYGMPTRFADTDFLQLKAQPVPEWMAVPVPRERRGGQTIPAEADGWSVIAAFAVLHHIPSREYRLQLLRTVRSWLQPEGRFFVSNWQFLGNPRMQARIQPWKAAQLSEAELDQNDYLLDWRHGPLGLRYVHHFTEEELRGLAAAANFQVVESFHSDGSDRRSGLYQVWIPG